MLNLMRRPWFSPEQSLRIMPESLKSNHSLSEKHVSCKLDASEIVILFGPRVTGVMHCRKFASSMDVRAQAF